MAKKKASEMSVLEVADAIQWCMGKMQENMNKLPDLAEQKAKSESEYDKQIEIAVLELKENNAATLVKDLAKGKCSDYKYKMSIAESTYKLTASNVKSYDDIMNGWQSVNRYLDVVSKQ